MLRTEIENPTRLRTQAGMNRGCSLPTSFLDRAPSTLPFLALISLLAVASCDDASGPALVVDADHPLEPWVVSQDFGAWNDFFSGYHLAEDAEAEPGDPVFAMADGVVKEIYITQVEPGYGAVMLIEHRFENQQVVSLYGHLSQSRNFPVRAGDAVSKGQVVGYIADDDEDGGPWGPHLHFGIRRGAYSTGSVCGAWLYVGYTRECAEMSHEEYMDMWLDPTDFISDH